jgi:hypothetical protein
MSCAALLAALFPGVVLADLDRHRVYELPAAVVEAAPMTQVWAAKACAIRHGIHWKITGGSAH